MGIHGTTILVVRHNGHTAMAADGQVTAGESVILKGNAKKIRKIRNGEILAGFAGSVADAFTLLDFFEKKLDGDGDLVKSALALAKEWRTNKMYHHLEASLLLADKSHILFLSGSGELIEPEDPIMAIGSGGYYAYSAGLAYLDVEKNNASYVLTARNIAESSLKIASRICVYTNDNINVEVI